MYLVLLLLAGVNAPPATPVSDKPRWDPNVAIPAGGPWGDMLKSATNAVTNDPDPKLRRSAANALGICGDPSVVPFLLEMFHDRDLEIRKSAVGRFGQYPDSRAMEPLLKLLMDSEPSVRKQVLEVIDNYRDPRVVSALAAVLQDLKETDENRCRAAWGLRILGDRQTVDPLLAVLKAASAPPTVRAEAAEGLLHFREQRAVDPLIALLEDRREPVVARIGAAKALAQFGDRRASKLLLDTARADGPRDLKCWAAVGAAMLDSGDIDDVRCIAPIMESYQRSPFGGDMELRPKATALAEFINHTSNAKVRRFAAAMLAELAPRADIDPFALQAVNRIAINYSIMELMFADDALEIRKLAEARSHFEKADKFINEITDSTRRTIFHARLSVGLEALTDVEHRWSGKSVAEISADCAAIEAMRGRAMIYYHGDPFVTSGGRYRREPAIKIGCDAQIEGLIADTDPVHPFRDSDLSSLQKMPGIRMLSLSYTNLSPASLTCVWGLKNLRWLELPDTVGDANLGELSALPNLSTLTLHGRKITNEGLERIARLGNVTQLRLYRTAVTDDGLKSVANFPKLAELDLAGTPITDDGLVHLTRLKRLVDLGLSDTKVTHDGVKNLRRSLPNCVIDYDR